MTELSGRKVLLAGGAPGPFGAVARLHVLPFPTRGHEIKIEVPTTNRPE